MKLPKISLITLNLNGSLVLEKLLTSIYEHVKYPNYEVVIVDHGSNDNSIELVNSWKEKLNIVLHERGDNFSFSNSNNFAAKQTDAEYLMLINNDIWFDTDIVTKSLNSLENKKGIKLLGIRLDDREEQAGISKQSTQHIGIYFDFSNKQQVVRPFEARSFDQYSNPELNVNGKVEVPAVTGALMLTHKSIYQELGGFEEDYFYGYEDVDLCLKYQEKGYKVVCDTNIIAYHSHGFSRKKFNSILAQRQKNNRMVLDKRYGSKLRKWYRHDLLNRPGFWTGRKPVIAFAVTEANSDTLAGDYFTAYELAYYLQKNHTCECFFVEHQKNWFQLDNVDILISMRDDYNPRDIINSNPNIIKVAWVRNWFVRFVDHEFSDDFDIIWASSKTAADFISERLNKKVDVIKIATNPKRFLNSNINDDYRCDYTFTGSIWGAHRELINNLSPNNLPFNFKVFGGGWDKLQEFASFSKGAVPYSEIPSIYASTKIVLDDANSVTKEWGSVNSRVFDALGAGKLVLTNGVLGSEETFGGFLPTYNSKVELEAALEKYLSNDEEYNALVSKLQELVLREHTYEKRAEEVIYSLNKRSTFLRIAIKICAPRMEVVNEWGDYHFAKAMKKCFDNLGYATRIDCIDQWYSSNSLGDDIVIVLRGLSKYEPKVHQLNLMWNISHPDKISIHEYEQYDHIFIASFKHTEFLKSLVQKPISTLLQCTDPEVFTLEKNNSLCHEFLFVGNSRGIYREIIKDCISNNIEPSVYGGQWDNFIPKKYIKGTFIDNNELYKHYASAGVVLNDHWESMKKYGFISNRVFDVLASGGKLVSDYVEGIDVLFPFGVSTYKHAEDLPSIIENAKRETYCRKELADLVIKEHSFLSRCKEIELVITKHFQSRS